MPVYFPGNGLPAGVKPLGVTTLPSRAGIRQAVVGDQPADVMRRHASLRASVLQILMDSRGRQAYVTSPSQAGYDATPTRISNSSYISHFLAISQRRFSRVIFCARSGRKARDLIYGDSGYSVDDIAKSVIAPVATHVLVHLGYNDIYENYSGEQVHSWVCALVEAAQTQGKSVVVMADMPPIADGAWIASKQRELLKYNRLLKISAGNGLFDLVPTDDIVVDYTVTGSYQARSGVYQDNIHPNPVTSRTIAKRLDAYYASLPRTFRGWSSHFLDNINSDSTNTNLIANGEFANLAGWTVGSGGAISSISPSIIDAPDGSGKAVAIDVTVTGPGNVNLLSCDRAGFVPLAGDSIWGAVSAWTQGLGGSGIPSGIVNPYLRLDITTDSSDHGRHAALYPTTSAGEAPITELQDLLIETFPYHYSGAEKNLSRKCYLAARFASAGSARVIFAHFAVLKNQPLYEPFGWEVR